ncbi:hypothetical protein D9758_011233 [Tetrapyrgos nigripes]|uniref:Uncharacterized protein n=1 Tax=Tetrapyrgos nigripes TaxID=182062 RepID=A0A8H5D8A0_9AGAR|nr:hypothetical protein D9758_011233 [Tetrapyrgos nigripes]
MNRVEIVEWLLENGAKAIAILEREDEDSDLNAPTPSGYELRILAWAAELASPQVISLLVNRGRVCPPSIAEPWKALRMLAVWITLLVCWNWMGVLNEIGDEDFSPQLTSIVDEEARGMGTALHAAASAGYVEIVRLLLKEGANPSRKDTKGRTARQIALENRHTLYRDCSFIGINVNYIC